MNRKSKLPQGFIGDIASYGQGGCGCRGGCVTDVDDAIAFQDEEIVHEVSLAVAGHGPHAGAAAFEVIVAYLWDQVLEGSHEGTFREGAVELVEAEAPVLGGQPLEAREGEGFGQFTGVYIPSAVPFAAEGEHGIGAGLDSTADHARIVHAEEREGRVG